MDAQNPKVSEIYAETAALLEHALFAGAFVNGLSYDDGSGDCRYVARDAVYRAIGFARQCKAAAEQAEAAQAAPAPEAGAPDA